MSNSASKLMAASLVFACLVGPVFAVGTLVPYDATTQLSGTTFDAASFPFFAPAGYGNPGPYGQVNNTADAGWIWGDGGTYGTWWTANPEEIHGINFLPINGGSLYLGRDTNYVKDNFANMLASNRNYHNGGFDGDPARIDRWHDVLFEYLALADMRQEIFTDIQIYFSDEVFIY